MNSKVHSSNTQTSKARLSRTNVDGLAMLARLYAPSFALVAVRAYAADASPRQFYGWFLAGAHKQPKGRIAAPSNSHVLAAACLSLVSYLQVLAGIGAIAAEFQLDFAGGLTLGSALLIGLPFVTVLLTPFFWFLARAVLAVIRPKKTLKAALCAVLEWQVARLRQKATFRVVAVGGSVGKTSSKLLMAQLLQKLGARVRYQEGNYNDRLTVPLVVFGRSLPALWNGLAWLAVVLRNEISLRKSYPYDIVVLELGTDGPGQMDMFAYLQPELGIITAVTPEHMLQFGSLDAVAAEELTLLSYAKRTLINTADTPSKYLKAASDYTAYGGAKTAAGYAVVSSSQSLEGQQLTVYKGGKKLLQTTTACIGDHGARVVLAAIAATCELGYDDQAIAAVVPELQPFAGRMRVLQGLEDSLLIDDTYNASPEAVAAAVHVLENTMAAKRIAILGSMNELGAESAADHQAIGARLHPRKLDLLVTIGSEAEQHLAPAAEKAGVNVKSFKNPHEAGMYVRSQLAKGTVVLAKGSQNGVFAEEALKPLLKDPTASPQLVRQSPSWMRTKRKQFKLPA